MTKGGYRNGSGRAKSGYYKGLYCGSTYELCWVIYNLDHGVQFSRFNKKLESDGIVYYPDFLLNDNNTIIEIKGFEHKDSVSKKKLLAESLGYKVIVLYKEDLQHMFEYVSQKFGTKKFYTLYDAYKPKFNYTGTYCKKCYESDKSKKTDTTFCSRTCSGKYRKSKNLMSEETKSKISRTLTGKKLSPHKKYKRKYRQIWINDGIINTRIRDSDPIPSGFKRGRLL